MAFTHGCAWSSCSAQREEHRLSTCMPPRPLSSVPTERAPSTTHAPALLPLCETGVLRCNLTLQYITSSWSDVILPPPPPPACRATRSLPSLPPLASASDMIITSLSRAGSSSARLWLSRAPGSRRCLWGLPSSLGGARWGATAAISASAAARTRAGFWSTLSDVRLSPLGLLLPPNGGEHRRSLKLDQPLAFFAKCGRQYGRRRIVVLAVGFFVFCLIGFFVDNGPNSSLALWRGRLGGYG